MKTRYGPKYGHQPCPVPGGVEGGDPREPVDAGEISEVVVKSESNPLLVRVFQG